MPIYRFNAQVTCSIYTDVEAESLAAAKTLLDEDDRSVHILGDGTTSEEAWILESADGDAEFITWERQITR